MMFGKRPDELRATTPADQADRALAALGEANRFKA